MRPFLPTLACLGLAMATAEPSCDSCFVRGTRVSTDDGDRAIEDLEVGDVVLAFCPVQGAVVPRRIVALHRALVREVRTLTTHATPDEPARVVRASPAHPFWVVERNAFAPLRDVREGERVLVRVAGELRPLAIQSVRAEETPVPSFEVFNLSVEAPASSYFAAGILVHNKSPVPRGCGEDHVSIGAITKIADDGPASPRYRVDVTFARSARLRVSAYGQLEGQPSSQFELREVTAVGSEDGLRWTVELASEKAPLVKLFLSGDSTTADGLGCGFAREVDVR